MNTSEIKGISGWLFLISIGLVISPFRFYFTTLSTYPDFFENGLWYLLTEPDSAKYVKGFSLFVYSEIVFNIFLFSSMIYLNFLFFSKKTTFPKAYIAIALIGLLYTPINAFLANAFFPQVFPQSPLLEGETLRNFLTTLISAAIWVPYMLKSHRVKNTFIEEHSVRKTVLSVFVLACILLVGCSLHFKQIKYIPETLSIEEKLVRLANEMNKNLPKMLNSETTLDTVYTYSGNLQYRYSLVNYSASDIDINVLHKNMRPSLVEAACSNSTTASFMQEGIDVSYTYFDKSGEYITSIKVKHSDCV
ncbi:DUF2569 domain-containing protein [Aeromonas encheleia]|uniref:DUF2569 domain-containing protein n=1 Tax=Aeromonas encheleia TaxID=73010 RepID=UPI001F58751F|nr:DUF2569 domain-containing protein [Aeromonas encheleia]UNP89072.1 DUF2569 domain-containing protein [Aeromonas encheleia]